jgi:hypothetical protein
LELADQVAFLAVRVAVGLVEVGTQIAVAGLGSASRCHTMVRMELPTATRARFLPRRLAMRR